MCENIGGASVKITIRKFNKSVELMEVPTFGQLIDEIAKIDKEEKQLFFYRGQADKEWNAIPGIFRRDNNSDPIYEKCEREILDEFCSYFYDEFRDRTAFEKLLTAQHYELPTRLIDVTLNPLVALYFACISEPDKDGKISCYASPEADILSPDSDRLRILSNIAFLKTRDKRNIVELAAEEEPENTQWDDDFVERLKLRSKNKEADGEKYASYLRLMHLLKCETGAFDNKICVSDLSRCFFVNPVYSNSRIKAQSGGFIISAFEKGYEILEKPDGPCSYEILIPSGYKKNMRKELDALNINKETLFPEKAYVAAYLKDKYKQKH